MDANCQKSKEECLKRGNTSIQCTIVLIYNNNNTGVIKTPSPQPFFFRPIKLELYSTFIMTFEDPNIP